MATRCVIHIIIIVTLCISFTRTDDHMSNRAALLGKHCMLPVTGRRAQHLSLSVSRSICPRALYCVLVCCLHAAHAGYMYMVGCACAILFSQVAMLTNGIDLLSASYASDGSVPEPVSPVYVVMVTAVTCRQLQTSLSTIKFQSCTLYYRASLH